jgi:hypothetical protein
MLNDTSSLFDPPVVPTERRGTIRADME